FRYMDAVIVDQGQSSMYRFVEPQTIQPSGNTLESKKSYLKTRMTESNRDVSLAADGHHSQTMYNYMVLFAAQEDEKSLEKHASRCNKQEDSWECGFYVMSWIKTIIRAVITDEWNERFKSTSPIPEETIRQIWQEWTTYLLQRWS
ncbi:hypothetical protein LR48_Vigan10g116500, partial [Vigna angularis]